MPLRISDDDAKLDSSQADIDERFKKIADAEEKGTFDDIVGESDGDSSTEKLQKQEEGSDKWRDRWSGGADGATKKKKVGPIVAIALTLAGFGAGFGITGTLSMALIGIKENIFNKVDTLSSMSEERNGILMKTRLFGTSTSCVVKVKCRYVGITDRQLKRLQARGAKLVNADGSAPKKNPITGRYSGKTLILDSGEQVDANKFRSTFGKSKELKALTRVVMKPRWLSWNDSTAKQVRAAKRLVAKPDFGKGKSEKSTRQALFKAVSGTTQSISSSSSPANLAEAEADPDYKPDTSAADPGVAGEDIVDEAQKLQTKALAGEEVKPLSNNIETVVNKEPYQGKASAAKLFQQATSFINPAGVVTDLCTVYQLVNATVIIARVTNLAYTMRYATQFLSLADKMKAGDATSEEVDKAMNILMSPDETGDTFGDSFSYHFSTYGSVNNKPLNASAAGNSIIQLMSSALATTRDTLGGRAVINTTCFVSGALVLTAFIPAVGQIAKVVGAIGKTGISYGTKAAIKEAIDLAVKSVVKKVGTSEARKATSQSILKGLKTVAKNPSVSIFLASYLAERYAVPYAAQQIAGTEFGADTNGVDALDAINTGLQANSAEIEKSSGYSTTDNIDEYIKMANFNQTLTNNYIAEMQSEANPLDINNPYSTANKLAVLSLPIATKFSSVLSQPSNVMSLPATIINSLKNSFFSQTTASALSSDQTRKELNMCQDDLLEANIVRHASCVPAMIFPGIDEIYSADGQDIVDRLISSGSLDKSGNPTGAFADYLSSCADPNSSILDESTVSSCYQSTSYKLSSDESLFLLDQKILDDEDDDVNSTSRNSAASYAKQIIDSGNVSAVSNDPDDGDGDKSEMDQIKAVANGTASNECSIDTRLLKMIAGLSKKNTLVISDLNRTCSKSSIAYSSGGHYDSPSRAVDFDRVNGNGNPETDIAFINEALSYVDSGSSVWVGQVKQRGSGKLKSPDGVKVFEFDDYAGHLHLAVE